MPTCPCGSARDMSDCCGRYLAGTPAPTAEALMRSRYTAYAIGVLVYIAATCAGPAALALDRAEAEAAQIGTEWLGLEIIKTTRGRETDSEGTVKFVFRYRHNGVEAAQQDLSKFRRVDGLWRYWESYLRPATSGAPRPGRNDPCPCGSGKKFKKCCGADI